MSENTQPDLTVYNAAIAKKKVLLPDGRHVKIRKEHVLPVFEGDVWCDAIEVMETPDYEHGIACFIESVVNAGLCGPSGTGRAKYVLRNLHPDHASGDLFDWRRMFIDREFRHHDWRHEKTICDVFSKQPERFMNRLKTRVSCFRDGDLQESAGDQLKWRMCYLSLARKVFLARAGYPEFCERQIG